MMGIFLTFIVNIYCRNKIKCGHLCKYYGNPCYTEYDFTYEYNRTIKPEMEYLYE